MRYTDVELKLAANSGFLVCYCEETPRTGKGDYGGYECDYKKEAFGADQEKEALARFKELSEMQNEE